MNTIILSLFFVSIGSSAFSQGRIGFDVSAQLQGKPNYSFSYHHIVKEKFLISGSLFAGGAGSGFVDQDSSLIYEGTTLNTPYSDVDRQIIDISGTYSLIAYGSTASQVGIGMGFGGFRTLNENHSFRTHLYARFGLGTAITDNYYRSTENYTTIRKGAGTNYFFTALSFEFFHSIRLPHKFAFYYGVKIPYYFQIDKKRFNSSNRKDLHFGAEPEFTAGISYYIGKKKKLED